MNLNKFVLVICVLIGQELMESNASIRTDCECGRSVLGISERIIKGMDTKPHAYPWMAAMFGPANNFHCGGSIISDQHILTAAHCVVYVDNPYQYHIKLGMHDQAASHQLGIYNIKHIEVNPKFIAQMDYDDYDMAILTLDKKIRFSNTVSPICLPEAHDDFSGSVATVAGWGKTENRIENAGSEVLQETRVRIMSDGECLASERKFKLQLKVNLESMICGYSRGTDACQGDSGGPLFVEKAPNKYAVLAVVSFGQGCADNVPGIYGKISTALPWINGYLQQTGGNKCL